MFETQFGNIAKEISTRFGRPQSDLPVFGVDRFIGITPTTKYASKDLSKYKIVKPGMFVYNPMRLNIGSIGLCTTHHGDGLVSPDYVVFAPLSGKIDPVFLCYYIKTLQWSEWVAMAGEGSVRERIYFRNLARNTIKIPEFPDQLKIAAILRMLDDKIELNRKTAAVLEEMARALYRSWFVDFDPVWAKAEGHPPAHMDTATAALFPDGFDDAGLPLGWLQKRLGDLLVLNYGKALKKELREQGQFPVYGSGGAGTTHREALIDKPTIIVGRKGTVGSLRWAPDGCWPIDTVFYVTSALPLSFIMRTLQDQPLAEMNTDAAVPGLNRDNVYRLEVITPPDRVIDAFDHLAGKWQSKIDALDKENQTLATLRDSLLPRLMSGELRVGAARDMLEQVA